RLADLDREAPDRARSLRKEMLKRLDEWGRALLQKGTLQEEDHAAIRIVLELLEARATRQAQSFAAAYETRKRRWEAVEDLAPPFEQAARVFAGQMRPENDRLQPSDRIVLAQTKSSAAAQLAVEFSPTWEDSTEVGLLLNAVREKTQINGYSFELRAPPATRVGQRGTFAEARKEGRPFTMLIAKNGVLLKERSVQSSELKSGPLKLMGQREGEALVF